MCSPKALRRRPRPCSKLSRSPSKDPIRDLRGKSMLSRGRLRAAIPVALALLLLLAAPCATARADDDVMLQGFWWDSPDGWWRTLQANAYDFAKSGFRRVWLPPASKDAAGGYGMGYGPYDPYDLGEFDQRGTIPTRFGTRAELEALTARLN